MRKAMFAAILAGLAAAPAPAQQGVQLQSAVFVERLGHSNSGRIERRIEPAGTLKRGDRLVLMVEWQGRPGSGRSFAVTSPIPRTIAFERASHDSMEVSVDGGRSWGKLGGITLSDRHGARLASPEDVTHLRWRVTPGEAERGHGRITYSAIVR